jgi:hypothetical protein
VTPEAFEALVRAGSATALVEAVAELDDATRRRLAKTAAMLMRERRQADQVAGEDRGKITHAMSALAILAVGPSSAARKLHSWMYWREEDAVARVLGDRRPDWVDGWLEAQLAEPHVGASWSLIQALRARGVARKPTGAGYLRALVSHFGAWGHGDASNLPPPLHQRLRAWPEILAEDVWQLFEVETHAFTWDWHDPAEKQRLGYESWFDALLTLAREGDLDRDRLLDASLRALWTATKSDILSGYHHFHTALEPTPDEVAARQATYRELLSHKTPHVVGFALDRLKSIVAHPAVEADVLVRGMAPVCALKQKSHVCSALRLARALGAAHPEARMAVIALAQEALLHPTADAQSLAIEVLDRLAGTDGLSGTALAHAVERVHVAVRPRLEALRARVSGATEAAPVPTSAKPTLVPEPVNPAAIRTRVKALAASVRTAAGLDSDSVEEFAIRAPGPAAWSLESVSILPLVEPLTPLGSVGALIDAVGHAVEVVDDADAVERILDGIGRLGLDRPADFDARTAPLLQRLRTMRSQEGGRGLGGWGGPPAILDLLLTWLTGTAYGTPVAKWVKFHGPWRFLELRLRELAARLLRGETVPVLAAPTHRRGWIDPRILVERVVAARPVDAELLSLDFVQALLRLAPDFRPDALVAAQGIAPPFGGPLRWALGGDQGPGSKERCRAWWWVAAARARAPAGATLEELRPLGLPDEWPDVVTGVTYRWDADTTTSTVGTRTYTHPRLRIHAAPSFPENSPPAPGVLGKLRRALTGAPPPPVLKDERCPELNRYPSALGHEAHDQWWNSLGVHAPWLIEWTSMTWPQHLTAHLVQGVRRLMLRLDMDGSGLEPYYAYLTPLFDPWRPLDELPCLLLWVGLGCKDADTRRLAIDVAIEGIGTGRVAASQLATVLVRLAQGGWLKLNRISASAREVARVSDLHQLVVAETMEQYVESLAGWPRGVHEPLELLHELLVTLGRPIAPQTRTSLEARAGGGKAAKAARLILRDAPAEPGPRCRAAYIAAWGARVERAERLLGAGSMPRGAPQPP